MAIKASLGSGALRVLCRPRRQVERCCQAQRFSTVLSDLGSNDVENIAMQPSTGMDGGWSLPRWWWWSPGQGILCGGFELFTYFDNSSSPSIEQPPSTVPVPCAVAAGREYCPAHAETKARILRLGVDFTSFYSVANWHGFKVLSLCDGCTALQHSNNLAVFWSVVGLSNM